MVEIAPKNRKGFFGSFTLASAVGGLLLGSAFVMMLNILLPDKTMYLWGWRIPFLSGIFILAIGLWLREGMSESPEFLRTKPVSGISPIVHTFKYKKKAILRLSGIVSLATVTSYIMFVWMPTYLSDIIKYPIHNSMTLNTISMGIFLIAVPIAGYISDYVGHRKTMIIATIIVMIITLPLFMLLQNGDVKSALAMQIAFAVLSGFIQGPLPALMAEMFPVNIRYTSIGVGYNTSVAILGGTAPAIATWLIEKTGSYTSPAWYIIFFAVTSLLSLVFLSSV